MHNRIVYGRILLVGEAAQRHAGALRAAGFEVAGRDTGAGLQGRLDERPRADLVVLDVRLPDRDGVEACRAIAAASVPPVPVVLLSPACGRGARPGADAVLPVRTGPAALVELCHVLLRAVRAERALAGQQGRQRTLLDDLDAAARTVRARDRQVRRLAQHAQHVREAERREVGRAVHDEVGQLLTVLRLDLARLSGQESRAGRPDLASRLAADVAIAQRAIVAVQRISSGLRSAALDLGLGRALDWLARYTAGRCGLECRLETALEETGLPERVEAEAYHFAQEAVTNAVRHAAASSIVIALSMEGGWLDLEVRDDGRGLDGREALDPRSLGLGGLRERALELGGTATFERLAAGGTRVRLRCKVAPPAGAAPPKGPSGPPMLFTGVPFGCFLLAAGGTVTEANLPAAALVGEPAAALTGRRFLTLLPPRDHPAFVSWYRGLRRRRTKDSCEVELLGEARRTRVRLEGVVAPAGVVVAALEVAGGPRP